MRPMLVAEGRVVCPDLSVADTARSRMKGLLGRHALSSGEGLLLRPAGSVHTAFMRFPIDVVFLDASLRVLDVRPSMPPWRMAAKRGAKAVLELPGGEAARRGIAPGVELALDETRPAVDAVAPLELTSCLVAAAGVAAALIRFGFTAAGLVTACFLAALAVLAVIDLKRQILPDRILLPSAAVVFALQLALFGDQALEWTLAALGCAGALFVLRLARPGGLGMGDVKLGLLLGAGLGLEVIPAMLLGSLLLWPVAVWTLVKEGAGARTRPLPLAPALALGAAVVALAG